MCDERFHFLEEIEPVRFAAGKDRRVCPGFIEGHSRRFGKLNPPYPFDVHVAFPAGQEQTQRITVTGHDALAVLIQRDHGVIHGFGQRHAAAQVRRVAALGNDPFRLRIDPGFVK